MCERWKQKSTRKTQRIHTVEGILREELRKGAARTTFSWANGKLLQWKFELKEAEIHSKDTTETLSGELCGRYSSSIHFAGSQSRSSHLKNTSSELQDSNLLVSETEKPASVSQTHCFIDKNTHVNSQRNNKVENQLRAELEEYKLERHKLTEELKRKNKLKEETAKRPENTLNQSRIENEITGIKLRYIDKVHSALKQQKIQLKDKYSKKLQILQFSVNEINEQENKVLKKILEHTPKIDTEEDIAKEKLFRQQLAKITNEYERKVKNLTTRNSEIIRQIEELECHLSSVEVYKQSYTNQNAFIEKELFCSICKASLSVQSQQYSPL